MQLLLKPRGQRGSQLWVLCFLENVSPDDLESGRAHSPHPRLLFLARSCQAFRCHGDRSHRNRADDQLPTRPCAPCSLLPACGGCKVVPPVFSVPIFPNRTNGGLGLHLGYPRRYREGHDGHSYQCPYSLHLRGPLWDVA